MQRFESAGLVVEVSQVVVHEGDEPDALVGLFDSDRLAGEDLTEIDLAAIEADTAPFFPARPLASVCLTPFEEAAADDAFHMRAQDEPGRWASVLMLLMLLRSGFCDGVAATVVDTSPSSRTTFFDDFPYTRRSAYVVRGRDTCDKGTRIPAVQFVSTASRTATRVVVAVSAYGYNYPSDVRITVRRNNHGSPGRVMGKRNVTAPPCCAATTLRMKLRLVLGEAYWVEIAPRTDSDVALWNDSRSAIACTMRAKYGGAFPNWPCPAERIVGTSARNSNF